MDINNKEIRRKLIARYLGAETSSKEEKLLADYYALHGADEDEQAVARLIRMENIHTSLLSDEGEEEFERIMNNAKWKNIRWMPWFDGLVAASVALLFILNVISHSQSSFTTVEIAQGIQEMMSLKTEEIVSITATPLDEYTWVEAELKDGSTKTFLMSKEKEMGTTSLLAIN